jgi:hypothetical protein
LKSLFGFFRFLPIGVAPIGTFVSLPPIAMHGNRLRAMDGIVPVKPTPRQIHARLHFRLGNTAKMS